MRFYDLDIDVKNYAKRIVDAGYKCPADINSVSDFVKGLKTYNLWNNLICWPSRANQNAGAGTTVYSLGNIGIYNGTMVNSPTWQADGIVFTNTTQEVTRSGFDTPASPMSFGSVTSKSPTSALMRAQMLGVFPQRYSSADVQNTRSFDIRNNLNSNYLIWFPSVSTSFIFKLVSVESNLTANGYANGQNISPTSNATTVGWDNTTGVSTRLFGTTTGNDATIICAFIYIFTRNISASEQLNFYNLYKVTAGKGLGLP
jgi:hypothetical protein